MQPKKKIIDYKKYYSNELKELLDKLVSSTQAETPVNEITTEFFLMFALDSHDCMLYKAVNSFLSTFVIENIHKHFFLAVQDSSLSALRPDRTIDYSLELSGFLAKAYDEKEMMGCKFITSDHVLLAILSDNRKNKHKKIFSDNGLNYSVLFSKSESLHEIAESIIATENDTDLDDSSDFVIETISNVKNGSKKKNSKQQISYCRNLNKIAESGGIDGIIGREDEISKIEKVLARRKCNNVILVGQSGSGKTSLIEGIAKMIVDKTCPISFLNLQIYSLNVGELISNTTLRGMFEERVNKVFNELKQVKNTILFIDNAHNIINNKKNDDYGLTEIITEHITDNNIKIILSTNEKGYKSIIDSGQNLARDFQKVTIDPTNEIDTFEILKFVKKKYEEFHKVNYSDDVLKACISLSRRYITEVPLPASAIDILDEIGASKKLLTEDSKELIEKRKLMADKKAKKESLSLKDDINRYKDLEKEIELLACDIAKDINLIETKSKCIKEITIDDVYLGISQHTNIPVSKINVSEKESISKIDEVLKSHIIGQDEAIKAISKAIKRSKVGLWPKTKPLFSAMLLGSTGIGKTLTAKILAKEIFGGDKYLVRFDMSEYADKTAVNKLIGSSAGYVGYDNGGLLTEAIKNKKHAVLLIDEIEKADDEVFNIFLQILDDGFLTDNQGNKVDFKNTIILLTSNVGAKIASNTGFIGFSKDTAINKKDIITKELKNRFPPEFINRLDEIIYYNELTEDNLKEIIRLEVNKLKERVESLGYAFKYNSEVIDFIYSKIEGEKEYGARPVIRAIQNEIENKITDYILNNEIIRDVDIRVVDMEIKIGD